VQVDPIKPKLKPPGTKRLNLKHGEPPSRFAFKFNLRGYSLAHARRGSRAHVPGRVGRLARHSGMAQHECMLSLCTHIDPGRPFGMSVPLVETVGYKCSPSEGLWA